MLSEQPARDEHGAMSFFKELQTRNVFKVGIAYLVIGWVVVQIADTAFPAFGA